MAPLLKSARVKEIALAPPARTTRISRNVFPRLKPQKVMP